MSAADQIEIVEGEIVHTRVLALPEDAAILDSVSDPAAYVVATLERAKTWLEQARTTDLPDLVEGKARAEAMRCYVAQKELGHDAELSATEIVRRAERRIAQLIREGQEAGEIRVRGERITPANQTGVVGEPNNTKAAPTDFISPGDRTDGVYELADGVSEDEFDKAIEEAREEKNLSRANLRRKVSQKPAAKLARAHGTGYQKPLADRLDDIRDLAGSGHNSKQIGVKLGVGEDHVRVVARKNGIVIPADEVTRGSQGKRIDSNRVVRETVTALEGIAMGLNLANPADVDDPAKEEWVISLKSSIKAVQAFLKEMTQ